MCNPLCVCVYTMWYCNSTFLWSVIHYNKYYVASSPSQFRVPDLSSCVVNIREARDGAVHGVCQYSILSHVATQFVVDWIDLVKSGSSSAAQHTYIYLYVNHTSVPANITMQSTYTSTVVLYIE